MKVYQIMSKSSGWHTVSQSQHFAAEAQPERYDTRILIEHDPEYIDKVLELARDYGKAERNIGAGLDTLDESVAAFRNLRDYLKNN